MGGSTGNTSDWELAKFRFAVKTPEGSELKVAIIPWPRPLSGKDAAAAKSADGTDSSGDLKNAHWTGADPSKGALVAHGSEAEMKVDAPGHDGETVKFIVEQRVDGKWKPFATVTGVVKNGVATAKVRALHPGAGGKGKAGLLPVLRFRCEFGTGASAGASDSASQQTDAGPSQQAAASPTQQAAQAKQASAKKPVPAEAGKKDDQKKDPTLSLAPAAADPGAAVTLTMDGPAGDYSVVFTSDNASVPPIEQKNAYGPLPASGKTITLDPTVFKAGTYSVVLRAGGKESPKATLVVNPTQKILFGMEGPKVVEADLKTGTVTMVSWTGKQGFVGGLQVDQSGVIHTTSEGYPATLENGQLVGFNKKLPQNTSYSGYTGGVVVDPDNGDLYFMYYGNLMKVPAGQDTAVVVGAIPAQPMQGGNSGYLCDAMNIGQVSLTMAGDLVFACVIGTIWIVNKTNGQVSQLISQANTGFGQLVFDDAGQYGYVATYNISTQPQLGGGPVYFNGGGGTVSRIDLSQRKIDKSWSNWGQYSQYATPFGVCLIDPKTLLVSLPGNGKNGIYRINLDGGDPVQIPLQFTEPIRYMGFLQPAGQQSPRYKVNLAVTSSGKQWVYTNFNDQSQMGDWEIREGVADKPATWGAMSDGSLKLNADTASGGLHLLRHIPSGSEPRKYLLEATVTYFANPGGGFFWARSSDQDFCFLHLSFQAPPVFPALSQQPGLQFCSPSDRQQWMQSQQGQSQTDQWQQRQNATQQQYWQQYQQWQQQGKGASMVVGRGAQAFTAQGLTHAANQPCLLRIEVDLDANPGAAQRGAGTIYVNGQKAADLSQMAGELDDGKIGLFSTESCLFKNVRVVVVDPGQPFPL